MFDLIFLGTSASVPSVERNQSALLVAAAGHRILVDCGEGTQRQLLRSGAGFRRLDRILLTHGHLDHMLGLPGLLSTLGLQERRVPLIINGGRDTLALVARVMAALWGEGRAPVAVRLDPVSPGPVVELGEFAISCFPVEHRETDSFGYVFESAGRRHLRPDRLAALGIPEGPLRRALAKGEDVMLEDGSPVAAATMLGPAEPGTKLVVIGDTGTTEGLDANVRNADALVIEATFLARDAETARRYGHLTAEEGAALAKRAGVKRLYLSHQSNRYGPGEIGAAARAIFPQAVLAEDMDRVTV